MMRKLVLIILAVASAACGGAAKKAPTSSAYCKEIQVVEDLAAKWIKGDRLNIAALRQSLKPLQTVQDIAPLEVVGDVIDVRHAVRDLVADLSKTGGDVRKIRPETAAFVTSPELEKASDRIEADALTRCPNYRPAAGRDRTTRVDLRNGLLVAKTYFTDHETFAATGRALRKLDPTLRFGALAQANTTTIGFKGTRSWVLLIKQVPGGNYLCIAHSGRGARYGRGKSIASVDTLDECSRKSW